MSCKARKKNGAWAGRSAFFASPNLGRGSPWVPTCGSSVSLLRPANCRFRLHLRGLFAQKKYCGGGSLPQCPFARRRGIKEEADSAAAVSQLGRCHLASYFNWKRGSTNLACLLEELVKGVYIMET